MAHLKSGVARLSQYHQSEIEGSIRKRFIRVSAFVVLKPTWVCSCQSEFEGYLLGYYWDHGIPPFCICCSPRVNKDFVQNVVLEVVTTGAVLIEVCQLFSLFKLDNPGFVDFSTDSCAVSVFFALFPTFGNPRFFFLCCLISSVLGTVVLGSWGVVSPPFISGVLLGTSVVFSEGESGVLWTKRVFFSVFSPLSVLLLCLLRILFAFG